MNMLKFSKEKKLTPVIEVLPDFNLDDEDLLMFIWSRVGDMLISSKNQNYKKVLFQTFKTNNIDPNLQKALNAYTQRFEAARIGSNKQNPLEKIVESDFMRNYANLFEFSKLYTFFFILLVLNSKEKWLFDGAYGDDIQRSATILSCLSGFQLDDCIRLVRKHSESISSNARKLLFSNNGEVKNIVAEYFYNKELFSKYSPIECSYDLYGDFYPLESISNENSLDLKVVSSLLKPCLETHKAVFVSAYGQDDYSLKNFLPYVLEKEKFKTVYFEVKDVPKCSDQLFLFLAFSAQLCKNYAFLVSEKTMENLIMGGEDNSFLEELFEPTNEIDSSASSENKSGSSLAEGFSLLDLVQTPVFVLANPFEEEKVVFVSTGSDEEEENLMLPNFKQPKAFAKFCSFNWRVKAPQKNEYKGQFIKFMSERGIEETRAGEAAETCKTLRVPPSDWPKVYEVIDSLTMLTQEELSRVINSKFSLLKDFDNLRKNGHYTLDVLNTSIPAQEVVQSIMNAEKWQQNQYDFDSGLRILLYGISGTGKTAFVEYIAKTLDKPLIFLKTSDFLRSRAGDSEKIIKMTFEQASKTNSILFIDEADTILRDRKSVTQNWEASLVNDFIQQMERFPGIMFCSTNIPEFLDNATNRRFHIQIEFKKLDKKGIRTLCGTYFGNYHFSESQLERIYNSGDVCPGDFGAVYGKLRFLNPETISASYICEQLIQAVKLKNRGSRKTIGFTR